MPKSDPDARTRLLNYRVPDALAERQKIEAAALGISLTELFNLQLAEYYARRTNVTSLVRFCRELIREFGPDGRLTATLRGPRQVDVEIDGKGWIFSTRRDPHRGGVAVISIGNEDQTILVQLGSVINAPGAQLTIRLGDLLAAVSSRVPDGAAASGHVAPIGSLDDEMPEDPDRQALPEDWLALDGKVVHTEDGPATVHADPLAYAEVKRAVDAARDTEAD